MRTGNAVRLILLVIILFVVVGHAQQKTEVDPRAALLELSRVGAKEPFFKDSPDVHLEKASLNKFFTDEIYRRLEGNMYFGYRWDEGFILDGNQVRITELRDITTGEGCLAAYRLALETAVRAAGLTIDPKASCEIGVCIVGVERRATTQTLPGVMVEAYLRNPRIKKSFFIRYGAGNQRGLAAAIRLSAEMLIAEMTGRQTNNSGVE